MIDRNEYSKLFDQVFDKTRWHLSTSLIRKKNFSSVVVPGYPDQRTLRYFCDAAKLSGVDELIYLSFGGDLLEEESVTSSHVKPDLVGSKVFSMVSRSLAIVNKSLDFIIHKQDDNSYFILAGAAEFMNVACEFTYEDSKENWMEFVQNHNEMSKRVYLNAWRDYSVAW